MAALLPSCEGILSGVYDGFPVDGDTVPETVAGQLYVDASDWLQWHYIDMHAVAGRADDESFNPSSAWQPFEVSLPKADAPVTTTRPATDAAGIYTWWYDVYGAGLGNRGFRTFSPAELQGAPASWDIAVHRNNVRTNGGAVARTAFGSLDQFPADPGFLETLDYVPDTFNDTDVWVVQDRMLLGLIGNQGIAVNPVLSSWLGVGIPPMPPKFTLDSSVFVVRFADGTYGAFQLADYQSAAGVKCCLTINYRYPL